MILGSIIGLGGGIIQDIISYYKDKKQRELDIKEWKQKVEFNFELEKQRFEFGITKSDKNIELERLKNNRIKNTRDLESTKNEGFWFDAISKATNYLSGSGALVEIANFIIATTRPIISYLFLFFIAFIYKTQVINSPEWIDKFVMAVLLQMEVITSFWFYRRGSDRLTTGLAKSKDGKK
jgi:hypothetical protein